MPIIAVAAPAPYGKIRVNTDFVYAVVENDVGTGSKLLIDTAGGRSIEVLEDLDAIDTAAGRGVFAIFKKAALTSGSVLINRSGWVSIVPHPQVPKVTQINFKNHYIAVKASLDVVAKALS